MWRCRKGAGLLLIGFLGSCSSPSTHSIASSELANLSISGIYRSPVTLRNGVYEGKPYVAGGAARPRLELVNSLRVSGDLDGDGLKDTAVFLIEKSAGSGTFTWLAVIARREGQVQNIATRRIGDRVQLRSLTYDEGSLIVEMIAAGPTEPACCPTRKIRNTYRLDGVQLVEVESWDEGRVSSVDLEGRVWQLTRFPIHTPVPDGISITLVFDGGRVSGTSGCNRYFASMRNTQAEEISIGTIGSTRMACSEVQMDIESRYLQALQRVERFSFLAGDLCLVWRDKSGLHTMRFK